MVYTALSLDIYNSNIIIILSSKIKVLKVLEELTCQLLRPLCNLALNLSTPKIDQNLQRVEMLLAILHGLRTVLLIHHLICL